MAMRVYVSDVKVKIIRVMERQILPQVHRNRQIILADSTRRFCGVCVSLLLDFPLARFFTSSLFFDLSNAEQKVGKQSSARSPTLRPSLRFTLFTAYGSDFVFEMNNPPMKGELFKLEGVAVLPIPTFHKLVATDQVEN